MAWGWESSMEAAGALGAAAPILESIPNPPGGAGWLSQGPQFQTKFQFCQVLRMGGTKFVWC